MSGIPPNDEAYDGTFQVLLYTGQRLLRDFEVETEMEITFEWRQIFQRYTWTEAIHRVYVRKYSTCNIIKRNVPILMQLNAI